MTLLEGTLADVDLASLAAGTSLGRSSLRLELRNASGQPIGTLVFKAGYVVSAIAGAMRGRAALRMLLSSGGDTRFRLAREPLDHARSGPLASIEELVRLGGAADATRPVASPVGRDGIATRAQEPLRRPALRAAVRILMMHGRLDEFDLFTLLQTTGLGRQLIEIEIRDRDGSALGTVSVKGGKIVFAQAVDIFGIAAVGELMSSPRSFQFAAFRITGELRELRELASVSEAGIRLARKASELPDRPVMEGSLSEFDIPTLLQTVGSSRQCYALEIHDELTASGRIILKSGTVVSATAGELAGMRAIRHLMSLHGHERFRVLRLLGEVPANDPLGPIGRVLLEIEILRAGPNDPAVPLDAFAPLDPLDAPEPSSEAPHAPSVAPVPPAIDARIEPARRRGSSARILRWLAPLLVVGGAVGLVLLRRASDPAPVEPHRAPAVSSTAPVQASAPPVPAPQAAPAPRPAQAAAPAPVAPPPTPAVSRAAPPAASAPPAPAAIPAAPPVMTIRNAQLALKQLGYHPGSLDAAYGRHTRAALVRFQRAQRLRVTGALDQATWQAILSRWTP